MVDEIKAEFEGPVSVRNAGRGQSACGDIQGNIPPVIDERRKTKTNLADDLRPHVQSGVRIPPGVEREGRPACRAIHCVVHCHWTSEA